MCSLRCARAIVVSGLALWLPAGASAEQFLNKSDFEKMKRDVTADTDCNIYKGGKRYAVEYCEAERLAKLRIVEKEVIEEERRTKAAAERAEEETRNSEAALKKAQQEGERLKEERVYLAKKKAAEIELGGCIEKLKKYKKNAPTNEFAKLGKITRENACQLAGVLPAIPAKASE